MASFIDKLGRRWAVELTVGSIRQVRRALDVDLLGGPGAQVLRRLSADPVFLADLLYVVCLEDARLCAEADVDMDVAQKAAADEYHRKNDKIGATKNENEYKQNI